jgi:hypothetical protein
MTTHAEEVTTTEAWAYMLLASVILGAVAVAAVWFGITRGRQ